MPSRSATLQADPTFWEWVDGEWRVRPIYLAKLAHRLNLDLSDVKRLVFVWLQVVQGTFNEYPDRSPELQPRASH